VIQGLSFHLSKPISELEKWTDHVGVPKKSLIKTRNVDSGIGFDSKRHLLAKAHEIEEM
jgi:hypothetical protein